MASNEETNAAGTDTRPPMLVESDYDSWKIRIHRYIRGKPNGKLIWKSIQNGPTPHPMITDPPTTDSAAVPAPREKLDSEFSEEENKLEMADTQAEIILIMTVQYYTVIIDPHGIRGTKACDDAGKARIETVPSKDYILLPLWMADPPFSQCSKSSQDDGSKPSSDDEKKVDEDPRKDSESIDQEKDDNVNSTNNVNAASTNEVNAVDDDEDVGAKADMNNLDAFMPVSPIPTTRIHKDHPLNQLIGDFQSATQTRNMSKNLEEYGFVSTTLKQRTNHKDLQNCLFGCFLSQEEPKKVKTVNGEVQLQALVDGKKIIITESTIRRDLQLEDAEGVDCLPNATIFEQLTLMGAKTTTWNEFSSTMASAIICLATNQKFNFSKYIFESMVKNLDNAGKFLMYPRVGKGFSRRETPLFQTMMVQDQAEIDNVADEAINEEMDNILERAATTTSLDVEQDRGNINKTQSKATPNEPSSPGTSLGGGPKRQETMGDIIA
ncbi:hypothetical protein Tco_0015416 [Tanacetum coccineum]